MRRLALVSLSARRSISRRSLATAVPTNYVNIVEVGPRDGLQNEKAVIPVDTKVELINRLGKAGLKMIEAGSFVSPKWVPQVRRYIFVINARYEVLIYIYICVCVP
jgi:hydroxymethylglutaryl-CoA lyase